MLKQIFFAISEKHEQVKSIKMPISIGEKQVTALLDTGSTLSYICERNIKHLSNTIYGIEETEAEMADGSRIKLNRGFDANIMLQTIKKTQYKVKFKNNAKLVADVILVMDFL